MTGPKPTPRPRPAVTPAAIAQRTAPPVKVPVVDVTDEQLAAATAFGEVVDGTVMVADGDAKVEVGPARGENALETYARQHYETVASVERLRARIAGADMSVKDLEDALRATRGHVEHEHGVGDLAALRARFAEVEAEATTHIEELKEQRRAAREEATTHRETIVARAEEIAAADPETIHWKDSTTQMRALMDEWKTAQKDEARISKDAEKALWKRLSHARSTFDKARKAHFAQLDKANADIAGAKEDLVAQAERLAETTDWDRGARGFKDLMDKWRAAGRGRRSVDDALWNRFKAAQDAFFEAKRTASDAEDAALAENVPAKEAAVEAAEAILPVTNLDAAKSQLRAAQDKFDAAGMVPRADVARLNARMGAVEKAVRDADDKAWNSRNPELEARASGMVAQLEAAITDIEAELAAAEAKGDAKKAAKLAENLDARRAWLKQISGS